MKLDNEIIEKIKEEVIDLSWIMGGLNEEDMFGELK